MVSNFLICLYFAISLFLIFRCLRFFETKNQDGDPEGLDALAAVTIGLFWPASMLIYFLYKYFCWLT